MNRTDEKIIRKYLSANAQAVKIETVRVIDSTNEEMKRRAMKGEKEISLLIAEHQTQGRGTKGRSFFSPDGTGIYMSFLLRPSYSPEECTLLTTMAAVCTAKAIEKATGRKTDIKWVNDIYMENRKVAGILTQAHISPEKNSLDWAVVGIGINITVPESGFPCEIEGIAGAVSDGSKDIKNLIVAEIINNLTFYYPILTQKSFISEYSERLLWRNKAISVTKGNESFSATVLDIDSMCHLKVRLSDGTEKILESAEISPF